MDVYPFSGPDLRLKTFCREECLRREAYWISLLSSRYLISMKNSDLGLHGHRFPYVTSVVRVLGQESCRERRASQAPGLCPLSLWVSTCSTLWNFLAWFDIPHKGITNCFHLGNLKAKYLFLFHRLGVGWVCI